jgi:hypothetical protein
LKFSEAFWTAQRFCQYAQNDVIALFDQWLDIKTAWQRNVEDVPQMCELFFGKTWCDMALRDTDGGYVADHECIGIVAEARPPFVSGLCLVQDAVVGLDLPGDLGVSV